MMDLSIPYYEDRTRISNSAIGWFLKKGPAYLHKMLTNPPPEEKNAVLERGTMIHEYLLQPEEFQKDYVVWDKSRPSSAQQEKFCQALAFSTEIEPNKAILSAYKEAYSTAGKSDDKMLSEGLKIASTLKEYIDFLKANDSRTMISYWDMQMLEKIKQNVQSHRKAEHLLRNGGIYPMATYDGSKPNIEVHHEFHINWEWGEIKCKSLLDSVAFDFDLKRCVIMDLKTTQNLWTFEDSVNKYDYLRQLAFYTLAVKWYLMNERNEDYLRWEFKWYIVGIDTTGSYEVRAFTIEDFMIDSRMGVLKEALIDIAWHQRYNNWEHSREYYEGDGSETLNL